MKFLRLPVILIAFFITAAPATADDSRLGKELVVLWMEYSPSINLISFTGDGKVKLFLKKGEVGDLRAMHGTWTVKGGVMTATFTVNNVPISNAGKVSFENGEMLLTDNSGVVTRHRRHRGAIPGHYVW